MKRTLFIIKGMIRAWIDRRRAIRRLDKMIKSGEKSMIELQKQKREVLDMIVNHPAKKN